MPYSDIFTRGKSEPPKLYKWLHLPRFYAINEYGNGMYAPSMNNLLDLNVAHQRNISYTNRINTLHRTLEISCDHSRQLWSQYF